MLSSIESVSRMNHNAAAESLLKLEESSDGDTDPSERTLRISVANEQSLVAINEARLTAAVEKVLVHSDYPSATISIAVVDDQTIHALNAEFLQHDYPTDVLSFVLEDSPGLLEGELIVSAETAIRAATEVGWAAGDELLLYVIHGALHLVGYDDREVDQRAEMLSAELSILKQLGIALPNDKSRWEEFPQETVSQLGEGSLS